jgi:predicted dehydrogenase
LLFLEFNLTIQTQNHGFAKKEGGPVIDMGPYYLTALVNLLGPAKKLLVVSLMVLKEERLVLDQEKIKHLKLNVPQHIYQQLYLIMEQLLD